MPEDQFPKDGIFIKWKSFQAGVVGRLGVGAVIGALIVAAMGRVIGLW
jgi:hypothetical protein